MNGEIFEYFEFLERMQNETFFAFAKLTCNQADAKRCESGERFENVVASSLQPVENVKWFFFLLQDPLFLIYSELPENFPKLTVF